MTAINNLRAELALVPDVTPAVVRVGVSDSVFSVPAGDLRAALGPLDFEGDYCLPVGKPGELAYPPTSERQPDKTWAQVLYLGAKYVLSGRTAYHTGDDLDLPGYSDIGEPVRAVGAGVVTYARYVPNSTWGNVLVYRVDYGDTFFYVRYGHLNAILVNEGDTVRPGQIVAYVGNVGMPTAPHLHFDITKPGDPLLGNSPLNWPWDNLDFVKAHYAAPGKFLLGLMNPDEIPEPSGPQYKVKTGPLRVRSAPSTSGAILTRLSAGDVLRISGDIKANGYTWAQITEAQNGAAIGGYVAKEYLTVVEGGNPPPSPTPQPPPTPPAPRGTVRPIGIHVAFGPYGDLVGVAERLYKAGTPIPFIVVVDHVGLCKEIKRVSPSTITVYRFVASAHDPSPFDLNMGGRAWVRRMFDDFGNHRLVEGCDYHQLENEWTFHGNAQDQAYAQRVNQFYLDAMAEAEARGVKITIGNFMPGVPDPAIYGDALRPAFQHAATHGHAALFHWYTLPTDDDSFVPGAEYMGLRLLRYLEGFRGLPILIGEASTFNAPRWRGITHGIQRWKELIAFLRPFPNVKVAYWTVGGGNDIMWRGDDFTPYLHTYESLMKSGQLD